MSINDENNDNTYKNIIDACNNTMYSIRYSENKSQALRGISNVNVNKGKATNSIYNKYIKYNGNQSRRKKN